jgi:hypothetical protein
LNSEDVAENIEVEMSNDGDVDGAGMYDTHAPICSIHSFIHPHHSSFTDIYGFLGGAYEDSYDRQYHESSASDIAESVCAHMQSVLPISLHIWCLLIIGWDLHFPSARVIVVNRHHVMVDHMSLVVAIKAPRFHHNPHHQLLLLRHHHYYHQLLLPNVVMMVLLLLDVLMIILMNHSLMIEGISIALLLSCAVPGLDG